jgi:hypothetical protein
MHKEIFLRYGGKCLLLKGFHICVEKFSQGLSKVACDARSDAEVTEITVKRLLCCGFRGTCKAIGQLRQC